jgi:nucleotide-binding universal stress UspA family protein
MSERFRDREGDDMFKRILVPTDGSDITSKAIDTAIALAKSVGADLHTISVKEPFPYSAISEMQPTPPQEFFDAQERIATKRVQAVVEACRQAGVPCEPVTVEALHPWEAIIDHATRAECDLLVMASHGRRGVTALLLGSETQKVLTHSKVPVLIVR